MYFDHIKVSEDDKQKMLELYLKYYYLGELVECALKCDLPEEKHVLWKEYCRQSNVPAECNDINQLKEQIWIDYQTKEN